jgi:hypothetical protein
MWTHSEWRNWCWKTDTVKTVGTDWVGGWQGHRAGLDVCKFVAAAGNWTTIHWRPTRSLLTVLTTLSQLALRKSYVRNKLMSLIWVAFEMVCWSHGKQLNLCICSFVPDNFNICYLKFKHWYPTQGVPKMCGKTWEWVPYARRMKNLYMNMGLKTLPWGVILKYCGSITDRGKTFCGAILYHKSQNITSHRF